MLDVVDELLAPTTLDPMSASAYDTAIVVRSCWGLAEAEDLVVGALAWLRANQHPDGSWGGRRREPHDRMVCTLATVVVLTEVLDAPDARVDTGLRARRDRGLRYVREHAGELPLPPGVCEGMEGFEIIVPYFLACARELGLDLPYAAFDWVERILGDKRVLIPAGVVVGTALACAVEALGRVTEPLREDVLRRLVCLDGSVGCSPAASAHVYRQLRSPEILRVLREAMAAAGGTGGFPAFYPYELFAPMWVCYLLMRAGVSPRRLVPSVSELSTYLTPTGVGVSAHGLPDDCDDTSVLLALRHYCGLPVDYTVLEPYETEGAYRTWMLERKPSPTVNAHVLEALRNDPARHGRQISQVLTYLRQTQLPAGQWIDTWHISPYYATGEVMHATCGLDEELYRTARDWVLSTQNADGTWGEDGGSVEETACAALAVAAAPSLDRRAREAVIKAMAILDEADLDGPFPEMAIAKTLYAPIRLVQAVIVSARYRCRQVLESSAEVIS